MKNDDNKKYNRKNEREIKSKILAVYDSFIKREHFENGLKGIDCRIKLIELDENILWETDEIKEFRGSPEQLMREIEDTDILLVHLAPVTKALIERGKKLKLIGCCRGGPVNVNVKAALERGITVINTPGRNAIAVAELAIGFIFALARKTCEDNLLIKENRMPMEQDFYEGIELYGKTLGIVGFGRVGREVEKRAIALGMKVIVFDPYVNTEDIETVSLEKVFKESDFVSVHTRLTEETYGMIDEKLFGLMKKSAYFINTSRAELVKQEALERALKEKKIVGAALDVVKLGNKYPVNPLEFYTYYDGNLEIAKMDNVIITPHIGGLTREIRQRSVEILAEDVRRFINGNEVINKVK